jgi:PAS domain S-box-containing protein
VLTTSDHGIVAPALHHRPLASGPQCRGRSGKRQPWVRLAVLAAIFLSHSVAAAPVKEVRRVLILNEVGTSYPAINLINQAIQTALQNSPYRLEFYSEYLDTILFPDPDTQHWFRDFYIRKYEHRRPDVIITVGPSPLRFMQEVHRRAFPGVPIIFCLPNGNVPGAPALDPNFTGVENDMAPAETLEIALRLQPGTEHVAVVGGVSDFDKQQLAAVRQHLRAFTDRVDITYMTDVAMPDLLEHLRHLPNHTVVLLASIGQDAAGTRFKSSETGPMVAAAANAPVFSLYDIYLNHGEVGGDLSSLSDQGRVAGEMALRLFSGEKPQDIPRSKGITTYMFDWRALKRWRLREGNLPPGSIVLNRQLTMWESYKWYFIGGIALFALETFLIFALLWQRAGRRKAEKELAITYDRLRQAVEAGKSVGWDWDVKTGRDRWFGDLQTMFGIQSDTYCGDVAEFRRRIYPEDRELVWKAVADARQNRKPYIAEFRVVRNDGEVHWITARGQFYYAANGDAERMLGMAVDITERKQGEEALKKSEEKFSKAFRQSPLALTVTSAKDHRYIDVNDTFERMTGWQRGEIIGRTPFHLNLWVEPAQRMELSTAIQTKGTVRNLEFRFRCKDGEQRVGLGSAEAIEIENEPCILAVIADITERKRAEDELQRQAQLIGQVHDALVTTDLKGSVTFWNEGATRVFGYSAEEALGKPVPFLYPEDQHAFLAQELVAPVQEKGWHETEARVRSKSGREFPIHLSLALLRSAEGDAVGMIGSAIDITERERAENAIRESEQRFRLVANTAPVMIWMAGLDKLCTYVNQPWLEFTGRPLEAELGNGWTEAVHPDDLNSCQDTYSHAFDRREAFKMQNRMRRHDGEYRWVSDLGVPRFNPDGSFVGYIGSCIDVTDRKLAEESLATIGRRLIEAHEEERTWIARELHDDVNQRIALVAIELERWSQHLPESAVDLHDHIHHARQRLSDISKDIQALSHRLHSSKLEYLGVVAAANSYCKELSEQHKVRVEFSHADIPRTLPMEMSLCLFRVLQEGLQNAVKHSGAQHFKVHLNGTTEEIRLSVSDEGVGFDWQAAMQGRGLGLISMRERLQLVKGEFSVKSVPGRGTTIWACVPFAEDKQHRSIAV